MKSCVALIGLSGSGKSTLGAQLALRLGWRFVDTDQLIEACAGVPIATLFAERGEEAFRELEQEALLAACQPATVVATGGGCVERPANRALLREHAATIWLQAQPETLVDRLAGTGNRPLLNGDRLAILDRLAQRRNAHYAALADLVLAVDQLTTLEALADIECWVRQGHIMQDLMVRTPGSSYAIVVGPGIIEQLPARLGGLRLQGRVWVVSDSHVLPLYGRQVEEVLRAAHIPVASFAIPAGEAYKTMQTVAMIHDWLLGQGVERGDVVLALGGGVVGDVAGFVAATVLRGIAVLQVPTTVLAMVDSAIGGKTGVDHPAGKNLIGAFHQPQLVLSDTALLTTLPAAERAAGWTEAIKHGMIGDAALFHDLAANVRQLNALQEPQLTDLLRRAAGFKARIVSGDEREAGDRILLNYGHTIGHALEAWSEYRIRHGEAVAIGMCIAAGIAQRLGLLAPEVIEMQRAVLTSFGLPTSVPHDVDAEDLMARTASDKKVRQRRVQWILPTAIGAMTVRRDVPDEIVFEVLRASSEH
ncbi:MAG: 3-dehydroquinate synthase [Herpetosiphonaceae bacterium]|nr:3-dehydroquinate synthase [Herpetosiphonaceae bacterium]